MKRKVCNLGKFMHELQKRHPGETEFHQSVCEVMESVIPWYRNHDKRQCELYLKCSMH